MMSRICGNGPMRHLGNWMYPARFWLLASAGIWTLAVLLWTGALIVLSDNRTFLAVLLLITSIVFSFPAAWATSFFLADRKLEVMNFPLPPKKSLKIIEEVLINEALHFKRRGKTVHRVGFIQKSYVEVFDVRKPFIKILLVEIRDFGIGVAIGRINGVNKEQIRKLEEKITEKMFAEILREP